MNELLTVLVSSCDGYSDIWPAFFHCFRKNWPDCPYDLKLITNRLVCDGVKTVNTDEEMLWTCRVREALKEIDTPYVLLLLEDYFIGKRADNEKIEKARRYLSEHDGKYMRLSEIPKSRGFETENDIFCILADEEYGINLQAAVWEKQFLADSLENNAGSAWEFEIGFLKKAAVADHTPLKGCYVMRGEPLCIHNGILKGKWFPSEVRFLKKQDFDVGVTNRKKLTLSENINYRSRVFLKNHMPYGVRKALKRISKKFGAKFVSDI